MSRHNRAEEVNSISERRPDERRTTSERKGSTMPDGAARTDRLSVSLVIPCFREEATVATTLRQLDELARRRAELDWEMIVVDDGSDDATSAEVAGVAEELPRRWCSSSTDATPASARRCGPASRRPTARC